MVSLNKSQFLGLNDKSYYFSDRITSFPYVNPLLEPLREKNIKIKEIYKYIQESKFDILKDESRVIKKCERIRILGPTLSQPFTNFNLDLTKRPLANKSRSARDYIHNGCWM